MCSSTREAVSWVCPMALSSQSCLEEWEHAADYHVDRPFGRSIQSTPYFFLFCLASPGRYDYFAEQMQCSNVDGQEAGEV